MNGHPVQPTSVRTACPYCGVGCGVLATPNDGGGVDISGDPVHPANFGALCSKGSALGETLGLDGRLLHPMVRRDGALAQADWTTALDAVATGFKRAIKQHGPDAVAFYLSGQLLTEDYYVANKLMKGFIGSANVDTNSRLCMASSVAGHRRAFGADTVPGVYADLDEADLIVLVGSNAAWCHPVLFRRMAANKRDRGARLVVIDPRRTATAEDADLFLAIAPGSDTALFCGLLAHLAESGALDDAFIEDHTTGFAEAIARAREIAPDVDATAKATGLARADVVSFFGWFRATPRVVTCYSQGVNQSAQGTDKVNAIINCHLATGRIGRLGMGPFSLTGQPNAMGGREVGGLANQLAAHMGFSPGEIDRVRRFWKAPHMATHEGLKAVQMFDAIAAGRIKALWVMATNPAVSLPRAGAVRDALRKLELFVVSDTVLRNDTIEAGAHVLLPATAWGEKDGTVTNSERRITRQRAFLPAPGEAKPDWWIVSQVARRMGFAAAFAYRGAGDIFREHAALSAFENRERRDFDLGGLADLTDAEFESLEPTQWPVRAHAARRQRRFFADGGFFTSDRKARFVAPEPPALSEAVCDEFPLRLNTGRTRDQWHTMTRSGASPRLALHCPEPFVEVAPADAQSHGLIDGAFARITTRHGAAVLRVVLSAGQQAGSLFVPIHWSDATASNARVGDLVAPATDPHSGQPEAKATPAAVAPMAFVSRGFVPVRRAAVVMPASSWWARVAIAGGTGYLLATDAPIETWRRMAKSLLAGSLPRPGVEPVEVAEYIDIPRGLYRAATFVQGRLEGCLFIGPAAAAPQWDAVREMFAADALAPPQRRMVLSAKSADGLMDAGPMVCSCFGVGLNVIRRTLASGAAANVEEIGKALQAGTNCGSCLPELRRIVQGNVHERVAI
jgi:assimilatory nitrate reductase catalytic subunit